MAHIYKDTSAIANEKIFSYTDKQGENIVPKDMTKLVICSSVRILKTKNANIHMHFLP